MQPNIQRDPHRRAVGGADPEKGPIRVLGGQCEVGPRGRLIDPIFANAEQQTVRIITLQRPHRVHDGMAVAIVVISRVVDRVGQDGYWDARRVDQIFPDRGKLLSSDIRRTKNHGQRQEIFDFHI